MITWDRDMVAAIGDYQLRIWPNVSDEWTWYVYLAAPNALHTVAGGSAPDEVAARAAAEKALIRRLASYQGLAIAAELARLRRIETAACGWHAARDAARSGGNWRPGEPARRFEDACDVLAAVLTATAGGASGDDRAARIETAARDLLASGQARYDVAPIDDGCECPVGDPDCDAPDDGEWHCHDACEAPEWVGDLVPAAAMIALRTAVEGEVAP